MGSKSLDLGAYIQAGETVSVYQPAPSTRPPKPPPRSPKPLAGETWWIQAPTGGRALLTVEVVEATDRTVLLMQVSDGSVRPKPNAIALRYRISDFKWVEKVPGIEP